MQGRQLFAAALSLALLASAPSGAQTDPAPPSTPSSPAASAPAAKPAKKRSEKKRDEQKKRKTRKDAKRARKGVGKPLAPPAQPGIDEETRKALEAKPAPAAPAPPALAPPAPAAPAPAPAPPAAAAQAGPEDNDPPVISHTPATQATKGKPLVLSARITDPSGVFQPVVYVRKQGMGTGDYIPLKMTASRTTPGEYAVEIPAQLVSADLEYYLEAWDEAGNGPARAGAPDRPLAVSVEEEKKQVVVAPPPSAPQVTVKQTKGAPPAISHAAVGSAAKGQPIEINARLVGDTGVQGATVRFRHVGEQEYRALPMGDIGEDRYTATIPAAVATSDLEYYLEAFDKFGNGPGRSGAPAVPYRIAITDRPAGLPSAAVVDGGREPRAAKAFRPNPGRAAAWFFMAGFIGGGVVAGGEALGAWKANDAYTHTYQYEGRLEPELLSRANAYSSRARVAGIAAGAALVTSIVLFVVFPAHADTAGSGGDAAVVRF